MAVVKLFDDLIELWRLLGGKCWVLLELSHQFLFLDLSLIILW